MTDILASIVVGGAGATVGLQYGDIIKVEAPGSILLHENTFFIDYIDTGKIRCLNLADRSMQVFILRPDEKGRLTLADLAIQKIEIISRAKELGYAKENRLVAGVSIVIEWTLPDLAPTKARIAALEADCIQIETEPEGETLYIDFEYRGLPDYIQAIRKSADMAAPAPGEDAETLEQEPTAPDEIAELTQDADVLLRRLVNPDDIADDLDEINVEIEIPENRKRFTLEVQIQDMSDQLHSRIPKHLRTPDTEADVARQIRRYVELRDEFSHFSANGFISILKTDAMPLLAHYAKHGGVPDGDGGDAGDWLVPIIRARRRIYYNEDDTENGNVSQRNDCILVNNGDDLERMDAAYQTYRQSSGSHLDESNYRRWIRELTDAPFEPPTTEEKAGAIRLRPVRPMRTWITDAPVFHDSGRGTQMFDNKISVVPAYDQGVVGPEEAFIRAFAVFPPPSPQTLLWQQIDLPFVAAPLPDPATLQTLPLFPEKPLFQNWGDAKFMAPNPKRTAAPVWGSKPLLFTAAAAAAAAPPTLQDALKNILPSTAYFIQALGQAGGLDGTFAFVSAVAKLANLAVVPRNIRKEEADLLRPVVEANITRWRNTWREYAGEWKRQMKPLLAYYRNVVWNKWGSFFDGSVVGPELMASVSEAYGISTTEGKMSNSEILLLLDRADGGRLFFLSLLRMVAEWLSPDKLLSGSVELDGGDCSQTAAAATAELSKKYTSEQSLTDDNYRTDVFWDDDLLDPRTQAIIREHGATEAPDDAARRELIAARLALQGVPERDVPRMMQVALLGKKPVAEGDHALLILTKQIVIFRGEKRKTEDVETGARVYTRRKDIWVLDESAPPETYMNYAELAGKLNRRKPGVPAEAILYEFQRRYAALATDLRQLLDADIERQTQFLMRKQVSDGRRGRVLNDAMALLAAADVGREAPPISPFEPLFRLIVGQSDDAKRYYDMETFYGQYCRKAILPAEDFYWAYCVKTNTKLMPTALHELAVAFNTGDTQTYLDKMDELCSKQGALMEDGSHWIDRHSGYVLRRIELVNDNDTAFWQLQAAKNFRVEEEKSNQEFIEALFDKSEGEMDETTRVVWVVYRFLNRQLNLEEDVQRYSALLAFVLELVGNERILPRREKYEYLLRRKQQNATGAAAAAAVAKDPPYDLYVSRVLIMCSVAVYFVLLQGAIPPVSSGGKHRSSLSCKYSLAGWPLEGDAAQMDGVRYFSCILFSAKSDKFPWNAIAQSSQEALYKNLTELVKQAISIKAVGEILVAKRLWLEKHGAPTTAAALAAQQATQWPHFLPPFAAFTVGEKAVGAAEAYRLAADDFLKGAPAAKRGAILKLSSQALLLAYGVVEHINRVLRGLDGPQRILMLTKAQVPYVDNACCDEIEDPTAVVAAHRNNPLFFFVRKDAQVGKFVQQGAEISDALGRISALRYGPLFFYTTRPIYAQRVGYFVHVETLQRSFLYYMYDLGMWSDPAVRVFADLPAPPVNYNREWSFAKKMEVVRLTFDAGQLREKLGQLANLLHRRGRVVLKEETDTADRQYAEFRTQLNTLLELWNDGGNPVFEALASAEAAAPPTAAIRSSTAKLSALVAAKCREFAPLMAAIAEMDPREQRRICANGLYYLLRLVPGMMLWGVKTPRLGGSQWGFSDIHLGLLKSFIYKEWDKVWSFKQEKDAAKWEALRREGDPLVRMMENCPEDVATVEMWRYALTEAAYKYVEMAVRHVEPVGVRVDMDAEMEDREDAFLGTRETLALENVLGEVVRLMGAAVSLAKKNYTTIVQDTQKDADREKAAMMSRLKNMTQDERNVEKLMKKFKLGRWNVGKEVFQYNKKAYDEAFFEQDAADPVAGREDEVDVDEARILLGVQGGVAADPNAEVYEVDEEGGEDYEAGEEDDYVELDEYEE